MTQFSSRSVPRSSLAFFPRDSYSRPTASFHALGQISPRRKATGFLKSARKGDFQTAGNCLDARLRAGCQVPRAATINLSGSASGPSE